MTDVVSTEAPKDYDQATHDALFEALLNYHGCRCNGHLAAYLARALRGPTP